MAQSSNEVEKLLTQAEAATESKEYSKAEGLCKRVISTKTAQNPSDKSQVMLEMYNLSVNLLGRGKNSEAEAQLKELLPLLEARVRPDDEMMKDHFRQQEEGTRRLLKLAKQQHLKFEWKDLSASPSLLGIAQH